MQPDPAAVMACLRSWSCSENRKLKYKLTDDNHKFSQTSDKLGLENGFELIQKENDFQLNVTEFMLGHLLEKNMQSIRSKNFSRVTNMGKLLLTMSEVHVLPNPA